MSHRHFPFVVLEIDADDLARASSFYSAVFGWSFTESIAEHGALEAEILGDHSTMVRIHLRKRATAAGARRTYGHLLCVRDLDSAVERIVQAGGKLVAGPKDVPGLGLRLYALDTEGNEVAMLEPMRAFGHPPEIAP